MKDGNRINRYSNLLTCLVILSMILILLPQKLHAAPVVNGITGNITNGSTINISGTSFGSGPNVVIFDDFEKGANNATIATGSSSAQIGGWSLVEGSPKYSNSAKVSGSMAFRADMSLGWIQRVTASLPTNTTKYFYSYWVYMPATDAWPGAGNSAGINWKFIWFVMNTDLQGGFDHPVMLGQAGDTNFSGFNCSGNPPTAVSAWLDGFNMTKGSWKRVWGYTHIATNGKMQIWDLTSNGVHTALNQGMNTSSATNVNYVKLNAYGRTTSNCHPMFDDVYIATGENALARIEIGNNSIYNSCTKLTILTPTAWSSTSISAKVWQGAFSSSDQAYLFVVDSSGSVSAGYPIKFGASTSSDVSSDTTAPAKPTGVSLTIQ